MRGLDLLLVLLTSCGVEDIDVPLVGDYYHCEGGLWCDGKRFSVRSNGCTGSLYEAEQLLMSHFNEVLKDSCTDLWYAVSCESEGGTCLSED